MNYTLFLFLALTLLLAIGLLAWGWLAVGRVREQLRTLTGFEGMHFENCTPELVVSRSSHGLDQRRGR